MDYKIAFEILEIDLSEVNYNNITLQYLKKKYHKLALLYHPDKNGNTIESTEKFKKINQSFNYLKNNMFSSEEDFSSDDHFEEANNKEDIFSYAYILQLFLQSIMEGKYNDIISKIVKEIVGGCKQVTVRLFEDLDKDTLINIYTFLSKYRLILHINQILLEEIQSIILNKYNNVVAYKLNPTINDLFNNNIYKLYVDDKLYLVPLWYNELYFDGSGCEILVICEPDLMSDVIIDEDNNIYIKNKIINYADLYELIQNESHIKIELGDKTFNIPIDELYMKKEQYYRIKNQGLTKIKDDIYDVSEKADIIVKITLN
jgi:DnaJ-class molecular chaperone